MDYKHGFLLRKEHAGERSAIKLADRGSPVPVWSSQGMPNDAHESEADMIYMRMQMRIDCTECGLPVPVNGPWRSIHCHNCQSDIAFDESAWKGILEDARRDVSGGKLNKLNTCTIFDAFNTRLLYARVKPLCPKCSSDLPGADAIAAETILACPGCGKQVPAFPAPDWLRGIAPTASVLINASLQDRPGAPESEDVRPVMFSCLQCGAPLKVDGTSRILTCGACDADSYLPDPLWMRLHPAAVMAKWIIGFAK